MSAAPTAKRVPGHMSALVAVYFTASVLHFWHNAEFIALYPNMPAWISRETVYRAWLAVSAVGVLSGALWMLGYRVSAGVVLAAYGALGLAGLGHYALALCADHALVMNLTIWFEAATGLALAAASAWHVGTQVRVRVR